MQPDFLMSDYKKAVARQATIKQQCIKLRQASAAHPTLRAVYAGTMDALFHELNILAERIARAEDILFGK